MSEFIHLVGAEDVQRAARSMQDAAGKMAQAANQIDDSLFRSLNRFEELVARLEHISEQAP